MQSQQVTMELADVSGLTVPKFTARTIKSVVGDLKVVNWTKEKVA